MADRDNFVGVNSIKFNQRFKTDDDCLRYLSEIKWLEGYVCKRCSNDKFCVGKKENNRRCTKCRYDESPTAGTMFDKVKFSLLKAFHIAFKISTKKKGMSSLELGQEFELRQKTCWEFKWKVQQAMESSLKYPVEGLVHVDEFYIGGAEEQKRGRNKGAKKLIVVLLEVLENGVGRGYAEIIEHASSKELGDFLKRYVSPKTKVVADKWRGYNSLKKQFENLEQVESNDGKNFKDIHIHIMNIKGWLRGVHHHCSKERPRRFFSSQFKLPLKRSERNEELF